MSLEIRNTLTGKKEAFVPLTPGEVRMYVCGVTVYDLCHVGHARSAVIFDVIRRALEYSGYKLRFIKNFTDVDDKIIIRAHALGVPPLELAEQNIAETRRDMAAIGVRPADVEPRATEHIPQMIELIEKLLANGVAYLVEGDVYFDVSRFPDYGKLSGKSVEDLQAGARVEVDERKRAPMDFALWKRSKPGEPSWPSPWGPGRPGWHIECSAMSMHYLGQSFDIHGGGEDLIFPHHENEIAQSEAATGMPFVRYWIHNGFLRFGDEKMSKSLGNVLTIKELVKHHDPEALRVHLLGTHYRSPLDFAEERVREAQKGLGRFRLLFEEADRLANRAPEKVAERFTEALGQVERRFVEAMDDDFNTPQALGVLYDLVRMTNSVRSESVSLFLAGVASLRRLAAVLGLFTGEHAPPPSREAALDAGEIERLIQARNQARRERNWQEADRIRHQLAQQGVILEDRPDGTIWRRQR